MILLWVTLPRLPVGYWSRDALIKVTSAIGKPLHSDSFTANMSRISYERVLMEVDVAQPLLDNNDISTPYDEFQQSVEYDWRPMFCSNCMKFGHELPKCWNKVNKGGVEEKFQEKKKRNRRNRRKPQPPMWKEMQG
ncbi:uncharacterized protein LOC129896968 [Solanum dulcamara]|uniref:uncharacterized protein LOC129896968 n=1 Tax=Solanum dulcamara TaxID=45834 RepID=UPI00248569AA|nr:uncharacterized protein LOC129896968 [Solanum dulcamara]